MCIVSTIYPNPIRVQKNNGFSYISDEPKFVVKPTDISGEKGEDVTFVCLVDGNPTPSYTWFRNGDLRHVS